MFTTLQACRAAAALLVVLYHLGATFAQPKYFDWRGLDGAWFGWGDAGVDFFFVLSGFLIASVHRADIGRPERLGRYLAKRAVRIYPAYWIVCAGVGAAALAFPALRYALPTDPMTLLGALALVPLDPATVGGTGSPILFVAWSLQYEMLFYAVMAAFIAAPALGAAAVLLILAAHVGCAVAGGCAFPASFVETHMIFLFGFGVAAAIFVRSRFRLPAPVPIAVLATAAFGAFGVYVIRVGHDALVVDHRLVFGAIATLMIVALVQAEMQGRLAMRQRWVGLLGDSSYALYLLHIPIISVLCKLLVGLHPSGSPVLLLLFGLVAAACVGASVAFFVWIERPLLAQLGRRLVRRRDPLLASAR